MKTISKIKTKVLAILLTLAMLFGTVSTTVFAAANGSKTEISAPSDLPEKINEGESYVLTADIELGADQQIATIAGTLDGQGHTITLNGKALADTVSGTIQNLGIAGKAEEKNTPTGSFAMHFSGTIQNCFSTATVSTGSWMADPGGFVADMTGGEIRNSYFAGDAGFGGAFVSGGTVANLSHTVRSESCFGGTVVGINGNSQHLNDNHKVGDYGDSVTSWADAINVLNTDPPGTGYVWVLLEGAALPSLQDESNVEINRSALEKAIEKANSLVSEKEKYTKDTWEVLEAALTAAKAVPEDAEQEEVNAAAKALNDAISGLVRQRPTTPVALPDDGSVIEIASADDLSKLGADDSDTTGKYYALTADITLARGYYNWRMQPFNGVLDGQGHTITFDGSSRIFSFADIGEEGVIQNIRFQGTISAQNNAGMLGNSLKGAVLNCSSNITPGQGYTASGFAKILDGGVISNCYVTGSPYHAFVETKNSGSILNSYWEKGITNTVLVDAGSSEKPGIDMRTQTFVNTLNQNKGEHGTSWGQNSDGYPYFGPNLEYTEPGTGSSEVQGKLEAIKLVIDDHDVTNGQYTVAGSEWKKISVQAKYEGSGDYLEAPGSQFTFMSSNEEYVLKPMGTSFQFRKPGTVTMTVTNKENSAIKAEVELTSTYVPVESITPGISGTYTIHGRNANDWEVSPPRFNPENFGITIKPANASYIDREYYKITSSDPEVGVYHNLAYVPVGAGTVTYTATLTEPGTGKTVSGSSMVTYQYENPVSGISLSETAFTMKANTEQSLPIQYTGKHDADGWNITEPSINWSYSEEGIVEIVRETENGYWKREEGAPDNNMFVLHKEYKISALQEGQVTVTGTPRDQTAGANPITFTVIVSGSEELPVVNIDRIVSEGIASAVDYLKGQELPYVYGNEWLVFAFQRAGQPISSENQSAYYYSVAAEVAKWQESQKPTDIERVSIALTSIGVDITDVNGVDLGAMLYNHPNLDTGSNELAYALIALDAAGIEIPKDARWTREKMKEALLAYQKEDGGFPLSKGGDSGIDTTAMALQAFAPYKEEGKIKAAIEKALAYLNGKLLSPYYGYNTAEAESQTIIALAVLGKDPLKSGFGTQYRNIFSHLKDTYQVADGGFCNQAGGKADNMATLQALQALEAYRRYAAGEKSLWDMAGGGGFTPGPEPEDKDIILTDVNNTGITVTGKESMLNDMELEANTITSGDLYNKVKEALKDGKFTLYDLYLLANNLEVQPDDTITVSIPVSAGYDGAKCKVYRVNGDGSVTEITAVLQDGKLIFETSQMGVFVVWQLVAVNTNEPGNNNGITNPGNTGNTAGSPKTGDDSNDVLWLMVSLLSLAALTVFGRKKRTVN